jgi:branched-chain amino acid transport system substrate-binding protein
MADRGLSPGGLTKRAIEAANAGNGDEARSVLAEALKLEPTYQPAWLWFASLARDDGERKFCLERAVAEKEDRSARQALSRLGRVKATSPPELEEITEPPSPPSLLSGPPQERTRWNRWWWVAGIAAITLAIAIGVVLYLRSNRESEPVYVALATGMSGPNAAFGDEMRKSIQLYFDDVNKHGGVRGHPVKLLVYDDKDDATTAQQQARAIVADGRALVVIGHRVSAASLAAAPIYQQAGLAAVSSTSTADDLTQNNPWYFRTIFNNQAEGGMIAAYTLAVLGAKEASIVYSNSDYGLTLNNGFESAFASGGHVKHAIAIESSGPANQETVAAAVQELAADPDPGPIVIAMESDLAKQLVIGLRKANVRATLFGSNSLDDQAFIESFKDQSEEQTNPGYYSNGLYAVTPLLMDSLSSEALRWFTEYRDVYGKPPTWRGATTYEAAIAAVYALRRAHVQNSSDTRVADRQRVRDVLASLNSSDTAIPGLIAPIYFDRTQSAVRPVAVGIAQDQSFVSAPIQLATSAPPIGGNPDGQTATGAAITVNGQSFQERRVVVVGINVNRVSQLDPKGPTFNADFFLWLKYAGSDDAADIAFQNAVNPNQPLGDPIRSETANGITYRLYRVTGDFEASLDFHAFPFDKQHLTIVLQNRSLPASRLVYAIDSSIDRQTQRERLTSGTNASRSINEVPDWRPVQLVFFQSSVGDTADFGSPTSSASSGGVEYAQFISDLTIERILGPFLVKSLLPLALLVEVTYISLFFSPTRIAARTTVAITSILSSTVLLNNVTSSLPDVGYTVAIEWSFYAFIFLCFTCIVIGLIGERLYDEKRQLALKNLTWAARIYYPVFVAAVVLAYFVKYW